MIGFTAFKLLESLALKYLNIDIPPNTIALIDSAYLGLLYLWGQGPRTLTSLLFTGLMYGPLWQVLQQVAPELHLDKAGKLIQKLPRWYGYLGWIYTLISLAAAVMVAMKVFPSLQKLFNNPEVLTNTITKVSEALGDNSGSAPAVKKSKRVDTSPSAPPLGEEEEEEEQEPEEVESDGNDNSEIYHEERELDEHAKSSGTKRRRKKSQKAK